MRGRRTVNVVPSPGGGLHGDSAAVVAHYPGGHHEPQPRAMLLCGAVRLEEVRDLLWRHAESVVPHSRYDIVVVA